MKSLVTIPVGVLLCSVVLVAGGLVIQFTKTQPAPNDRRVTQELDINNIFPNATEEQEEELENLISSLYEQLADEVYELIMSKVPTFSHTLRPDKAKSKLFWNPSPEKSPEQTPEQTPEQNPEQTPAPITGISCGENEKCVDKKMCVNSNFDKHAINIISLRSLCPDGLVCCRIDNSTNEQPKSDAIVQCGYRNPMGVAKGVTPQQHQAHFGEFPWMVQIFEETILEDNSLKLRSYIGSGTLIAASVVLTVAHEMAQSTLVTAGAWSIYETYPNVPYTTQERSIKAFHKPKSYDFKGNKSDIALLIMETPFDFNVHISPICLPTANTHTSPKDCYLTGWGKKTANSLESEEILKKIKVSIVDRPKCEERLNGILNLDDQFICAGGENEMDACTSDDGAPLACATAGASKQYFQYGIAAEDIKGCKGKTLPGLYTRVVMFMPWITETLQKEGIQLTT
ncbi:phenoloxidase-activating factor 2-like [Scaptodrosophila lebanonensis]|uniref:Phenoloxidase-activating factor 2-like n=1 Tax=Drosophila lebanonensis TaxID=7225 RepID=A0A6J2THX0_DROLE|nr:phenoloxidase-activating factor 2-like [Scaptodrosophila lebanonensis]